MSLQQLLDLTDQYTKVLEEENFYVRKLMIKESKQVLERKMIISIQYNELIAGLKENDIKNMTAQDLKILKEKSLKLKKALDDNNSLITFAIKLTEEMLNSVVEQLGGKGGKNKGYNHMGLMNKHYKTTPQPITLSETL